jgi:hypothetical protein
MPHTRLAILGKLRAGKDSASDFLRDQHGFTKVSIAETVKDTIYAAFNSVVDTCVDREFAARLEELMRSKGFMRGPLQAGGLAARLKDPAIWIASAVRRAGLDGNAGRFVCPDVRYENEANILRSHGFYIVRVDASRAIREERALAADGSFDLSAFDHLSETELDTIRPDLIIQNEQPEDREAMFATLAGLVTTRELAAA